MQEHTVTEAPRTFARSNHLRRVSAFRDQLDPLLDAARPILAVRITIRRGNPADADAAAVSVPLEVNAVELEATTEQSG